MMEDVFFGFSWFKGYKTALKRRKQRGVKGAEKEIGQK